MCDSDISSINNRYGYFNKNSTDTSVHENTYNILINMLSTLSYALSNDNGEDIMFINKVIPDFKDQVGNVNVSLKSRYFPSDTQTVKGPFYYSPTSTKINTRTRGRQIAVRLESNGFNNVTNDALDEDWRLGTVRYEVQADGKR